ncbi:hypothetical protein GZH47_32230 (plasmid) [Paenibacillus rhizovicinus]|uniref:Uncharacterized protein n=1 Tax=Paenibacillus rhizovicinus TaxID=2704463 RepID=A0A6C0PB13_9BACL|nr:hypothetical protein [Paenibacillus rhizovicinus]QHW35555.1 hypothetical protein GZH47_32230 [Paenibacillus rhizovicinus]
MSRAVVFVIDGDHFDSIECPVCNKGAIDPDCIWCTGAGHLEQVRLYISNSTSSSDANIYSI